MSAPANAETLASRLDKLYEFDREPVSPDKLHEGRYFAAMFAGEHVAGTEFVIGALFVQWGARTEDLIWGLLIGNLLAVLSWAFICAPIAVRTRLTLYWYARRIIGPGLTVIYNIVNAVLYCCLAAAMIGVSASAVIQAFNKIEAVPHIGHPELTDIYPPGIGWIAIVLMVGAVVIVLAIAGFKKLSQFAAVCSPWMFPIFLAGALATLPRLGDCRTLADIKNVADTKVWTGQPLEPRFTLDTSLAADLDRSRITPALRDAFNTKLGTADGLSIAAVVTVEEPGGSWRLVDNNNTYLIRKADKFIRVSEILDARLGLWHIMFFAWFCNLAMHVGLSDMAVFRYARKWTYGFYSTFGMYLGHFAAWACAGIMGAVVWGEVNPGKMADSAVGIVGLFCVLLAGWTTANPTIYRAGLALQIITPNWPRWKITLVAGAITTFVALFPAIFMKLLNFVAIYGLVLMPIGAIIFVEHWLFPWLQLRSFWAERRKLAFNPAALLTWLVVLVLCFPIEDFTGGKLRSPMAMLGVHLFFRWLPGWFIAAALYLVLARFMGAAAAEPAGPEETATAPRPHPAAPVATPCRPLGIGTWIAGAVALLALAACLAAPLTVFLGGGADPQAYEANLDNCKRTLLIATVVYFIAAIFWQNRREKARSASG
ncbi:MAG TPA: hypothetical protein VLM89_13795 [Phycisphaerae bacterium]|nr:hypothetical protein [Phycisphaerae bacterium]